MNLLAYDVKTPDDKILISENNGSDILYFDSIKKFFEHITEYNEAKQAMTCITWNLDTAVAPILKLLGKNRCKDLNKKKKCFYKPYSIFYIPGKVFSVNAVTSGSNRFSLYGIEQYYQYGDVGHDIKTVLAMGNKIIDALKIMKLANGKKLTSPIAIYEEQVMSHLNLPHVTDMPKHAALSSWICSGRLWIDAMKLGYWENTYDYDLTSAFPVIARNLIDIRHCDWYHSDQYQKQAAYGYCRGIVDINHDIAISPITHVDKDAPDENLCMPIGSWETYLTKIEIDFIERWGIGRFEIIDGWWAVPRKVTRPLQVIIDRMLAYKSSENELVKRISKGISVGIYGKFGEQYVANRKETFGKYFNSCYFAEISTRVRLKVADFIYRHDLEDSVLHISVDGVLSDKSVELTEKDIRAGWKLSGQNPALIISPGQLFTGGKHPKGLLLPDVLKLIEEHPQSGYYEKMIDRRVTLADAVAYGTLEDIGNMKPMHTSIDLFKAKHGRKFRELPRTGQQLLKKKYDSSPIKIMEDVD